MDISPIKTQRDYRNTLKAIAGLMAAKRNTPEGDRLDMLVTLVEAWERKHYPFDLPDPGEVLEAAAQNSSTRTAVARALDFKGQQKIRLENRRVGCRPHPTLSRRKGFRWPVLTSTHQKSFVLLHEDHPNAGRRCGSRD